MLATDFRKSAFVIKNQLLTVMKLSGISQFTSQEKYGNSPRENPWALLPAAAGPLPAHGKRKTAAHAVTR
jgi:hypothetical protein